MEEPMNEDCFAGINRERLHSMNIASLVLRFETEIRDEFYETIGAASDRVLPFTISCVGLDAEDKEVAVLGFIEAAYAVGQVHYVWTYNSTIYINLLYTEPRFESCGIASTLISLLPTVLQDAGGLRAEAIILATGPQKKDKQGKFEQIEGVDFYMEKMKLTTFYSKRGFEIVDFFYMVKDLSNQI